MKIIRNGKISGWRRVAGRAGLAGVRRAGGKAARGLGRPCAGEACGDGPSPPGDTGRTGGLPSLMERELATKMPAAQANPSQRDRLHSDGFRGVNGT